MKPLRRSPIGTSSTTTTTTTQLMLERRQLFQITAASVLGTTLFPSDAQAGGLLQFPVTPACPLKNIYHFIRAGPSELEIQGIYSTNALFLTNRENALHPSGVAILEQALEQIRKQPPTIAYHSLAANGMDTGDFIARKLQMGREKLLPEFTYLDQRGAGLWNDSEDSIIKPAIWALDVLEGGDRGMNGRPPPNIDGTPNETLNDQFVRLRQFLSLQESRTAGDVILVIFSDGTGPALLSCMIAGIPYKDCHALEFQPGEVRLNITPESVRQLYEEKKNDPVYLETIEKGKVELKKLLGEEGMEEAVNLKELRENKIQADMERAYQERKRKEAEMEIQKRKEQLERQKQLEQEYVERNKIKQQEREARIAAAAASLPTGPSRPSSRTSPLASSSTTSSTTTKEMSSSKAVAGETYSVMDSSSSSSLIGLGAVGVGVLGFLAIAMGGKGGDAATEGVTDPASPLSGDDTTTKLQLATSTTTTKIDSSRKPPTLMASSSSSSTPIRAEVMTTKKKTVEMPSPVLDRGIRRQEQEVVLTSPTTTNKNNSNNHDEKKMKEVEGGQGSTTTSPPLSVEDALNKLAMAEIAMKDALVEAGQKKQQKERRQQQPRGSSSLFDGPVPTFTATGRSSSSLPPPIIAEGDDNDLFDDGGDDWLRVLVAIRDEDDDDNDEQVLMMNGGNNDFLDEL